MTSQVAQMPEKVLPKRVMPALLCRPNECLFDVLNGSAIELDDAVTAPNLEGDLELSIKLFVHRHFRAMFLTYIFAEVDAAGCEIYIPTSIAIDK